MRNIYLKAYEREMEYKSKYVNLLDKGWNVEGVYLEIENDLVDIMVFCKFMIEKIRRLKLR